MNSDLAVTARGRHTAMPVATLLRLALKLDAVVTAANGAAYLLAAGALDSALGLPAALLRPVGAFLIAFAALVWLLSSRPPVPATGVRAVVAANAVWALVSIAVLAAGWLSPTTVGGVWVALQALVVALFAALQQQALRRAT